MDRHQLIRALLTREPTIELLPYSKYANIDDFTHKLEILTQLIVKDPALFLERYGRKLQQAELVFFDSAKDDYEVAFHLSALRKGSDSKKDARRVKNRRFRYLEQLKETDYFTQANMANREPALFHEYIGQYEETAATGAGPSFLREQKSSLSELILDKYDYDRRMDAFNNDAAPRYPVEPLKERTVHGVLKTPVKKDTAVQPMDTAPEKQEQSEHSNATAAIPAEQDASDKPPVPHIPADEKAKLAEEFYSLMQERFLEGYSEDLDYQRIDNDASLDDAIEDERDAQDQYFDLD